MSHIETAPSGVPPVAKSDAMPWQLLVASIVLGLEGFGNFLSMFDHPIAATWLLAKIFFIVGFTKRWKAAYFTFLIVGSLHVIWFGLAGFLGIAAMNLVLVLLVFSKNSLFINRSAFGEVLDVDPVPAQPGNN